MKVMRRATESEAAHTIKTMLQFRRFTSRLRLECGAILAMRVKSPLANAGTQEAPIVLHTHLAAGQKIRHRCHHFSAAMRCKTRLPGLNHPVKAEYAVLGSVEIGDSVSYVVHFCCEQVQCHESL